MRFTKAQVIALNKALTGVHELTADEIEEGALTVELDNGFGSIRVKHISRHGDGIAITTNFKGDTYTFQHGVYNGVTQIKKALAY